MTYDNYIFNHNISKVIFSKPNIFRSFHYVFWRSSHENNSFRKFQNVNFKFCGIVPLLELYNFSAKIRVQNNVNYLTFFLVYYQSVDLRITGVLLHYVENYANKLRIFFWVFNFSNWLYSATLWEAYLFRLFKWGWFVKKLICLFNLR